MTQESSLEESIKSMSVSEELVQGRQLTKKEVALVQSALRGPASEDVLVCSSILASLQLVPVWLLPSLFMLLFLEIYCCFSLGGAGVWGFH